MTRFLRGGLEVTQKESSPPPGSPPAASTWHDGIGLRWLGCDDACVFFECWRYIPAELGVALALMDLVVIVVVATTLRAAETAAVGSAAALFCVRCTPQKP